MLTILHGFFNGTFQSAQIPFKQVYICLAASESGGNGIPCCYALLPNKTMKVYEAMFPKIKDCVGEPNKMTHLVTDFDKSVFLACHKVFPDVIYKGCQM